MPPVTVHSSSPGKPHALDESQTTVRQTGSCWPSPPPQSIRRSASAGVRGRAPARASYRRIQVANPLLAQTAAADYNNPHRAPYPAGGFPMSRSLPLCCAAALLASLAAATRAGEPKLPLVFEEHFSKG